MTISDESWERRILCSDGNCIGVIGSDGLCKECGQPYTGDLPLPQVDGDADETDEAALPDEAAEEAPVDAVDDSVASDAVVEDDDWEARTLCIDESCIGVIGPDGRCKECGKPYPGKADDHDRDTDQ